MATTGKYTTEVYIDNADGIYVFQLDGGRVRWAAMMRGADGAEEISMCFAGIAVQCMDPVEEGWEYGDFDGLDMAQAEYDQGYLELVASTDLYQGRDADMLVREDPEDWGAFTAQRFVRSFLCK